MRNHSMMTTLSCVALVALGFVFGIGYAPNESHAQQAGGMAKEHFVVVPGYVESTYKNPHYFVVTVDGKAKEVKSDTKPLLAPKTDDPNSVLNLKHSFESNRSISIRHSGNVDTR